MGYIHYTAIVAVYTAIVFHNNRIVTAYIAVVTHYIGNVMAYTVNVFKNNGIVTEYIGSVANQP